MKPLLPATILVFGAGAGACSLFVDTGGLSGTAATEAGAPDAVEPAVADSSITDTSLADAPALDTGADSAKPSFVDSFTRNDGSIGNGWLEKSPGTFAVVGAKAVLQLSNTKYRDVLVYRPAGEDVADVEVSVDVTVPSFTNAFPQIHARVQNGTVTQPNVLDSYILYVDAGPQTVLLARARGTGSPVLLVTVPLSKALQPLRAFSLRLRVSGAVPVKLEAFVEDVLEDGTRTLLGQQVHLDSAPERMESAGSVGFSADTSTGWTYDNFVRTPL